ncbi:siphovirus Gp157 family protein [Porcipelethomonas ammoniilytica]|uniref:siphovirus Gp157 family protein n=1 Tax=Porcipelethomonas ammoniilytica TaxID=2981722 RepID=UPI000822F553|nr:siphovirus Gp157 family protein [Porcipelethomonas ammoniilytica]MCU6720799.1 siphovirus Gp157 family protein [Porcipelethomonas ammoniilytica]SCJ25771.1 Siphovirus Gp157 [uncultured Ruminococcus sp.]
MSTMYELTDNFMAVLEMASDPEIPPEAIADTLEGIEGEIELKAQSYAIIIKELEGEAVKLKTEETRLLSKRKSLENNIKRIKDNLFNAMKITGKEKFKTDLFSFGIQKSPAKLVIDDSSLIPEKYYVEQAPKLDEQRLKSDLKSGIECEYAHLEQGEHVRIR